MTVVAVMWPPVSPKTPLFNRMQVTFSPRAAVWSTSCRPSFTMSPSPWIVNTIESGRMRFTPVATDGARPCNACTRSMSMLIENADRAVREAEFADRLEPAAERERLAAARAHVVLLGEEQLGQLVPDLAHL